LQFAPAAKEGARMRKVLAGLIGLFVAAVVLAAQTHDNLDERTAKDSVTLTSNLKVGPTVLGPGEYTVQCNTKTITFTRKSDKVKSAEVPCKGTLMPHKADHTVLHTSTDANGLRVLDRFLLRGSNVEHVFK
jgi:hypothetical protein